MYNLFIYPYIREEIKKYTFNLLKNENLEKIHVIYIEDDKIQSIDLTNNETNTDYSVSMDFELFIKHAEKLSNKFVVLVHNHPGKDGSLEPSHGDFRTYESFRSLF